MTTALEQRNIVDHLSNAHAELKLAYADATEAGDEDAETIGECTEIIGDVLADMREEIEGDNDVDADE